MTDTLDPLVLDLLEWIDRAPRTYTEVMEAWRTSCPRLTVWEDAVDRGFVGRKLVRGQGAQVELTPAGRVFLSRHGRPVVVTMMEPVVESGVHRQA